MNIPKIGNVSTSDLTSGWRVCRADGAHDVAINVPGDVHSSLLRAGVIADPYWRDTEVSLDWIHEAEWIATTEFAFNGDPMLEHTITFDSIDCHADVLLNAEVIGTCDNQFLRWDFPTSGVLKTGKNTLSVHFKSNSQIATQKAAKSSIAVPYLSFNNRLPHYNYLRKTQCHAGWDWNIALSPIGIYGGVTLRETAAIRSDDLTVRQTHSYGSVTVETEVQFHATTSGNTRMTTTLCGQTVEGHVTYYPGQNIATVSLVLENPALWWPVGHGDQVLHDLAVTLGFETRHRQIGLREVKLDTSEDDVGARFAFVINGCDVFMRGANWIPADALPERGTPDVVRDRLTSALEANFNMIRVWGGGQYEADWFYDMCSEMGILVWHDFMFACNLYPSHDKNWLASVRTEARQQIRRLSSQPCMALWCGDNELVGALGWYEESKADRDRYLAMYDRLNYSLEEAIDHVAPDVPFWPSSPSMGPLNFGDGWHIDTSGDMHFWDVWHSAKDFEYYRTVKPRFCSEFGFQSFPSMPLIETFTKPDDRSATSPVMLVHQRNDGGNDRIVETISRYFNVPDSFEDMVYLSQISQGLAMKTSIEFWRSAKPRCMGTLYWQLNDTWPVASWASLEYGGNWKVTQYMARRFHDPVLVTAQPDPDTGDIVLWAINDTPDPASLTIGLSKVDVAGPMATLGTYSCVCSPDRAVEVVRLPAGEIGKQEFLSFSWRDVDSKHSGQNDYLPLRPKAYDLRKPMITVIEGAETVTLASDVPAFYVTFDHGGADIYSDNGFTLLPGVQKVLDVKRTRTSRPVSAPRSIKFLT